MRSHHPVIISISFGDWRSLVARTAGGGEVAGSNPVSPTMQRVGHPVGFLRSGEQFGSATSKSECAGLAYGAAVSSNPVSPTIDLL